MAGTVLDFSVFDDLKRTVGDEFIAELVGTFLEEAPPMLAELRRALVARDAELFRRTAHSLKTNANTFGALPLGELAKALEHACLPDDESNLMQFEEAYLATATALRALIDG